MPVPDPPFNATRIMKVLEPSAGQYEVVVRMDPTLAAKFPDKPFGTAIDQIGLATKDSAKYEGYTLVSIEPAGKDHFWVFQKLSGPEWTTTSNSRDNLTPAKYRGQTVVVKTEQEVAPATLPTTLAGDLVASVVARTPNTGKAVLTETTETIEENVAALAGQQFAPDGTLLATTEVLVSDGALADKSLNVAQSTVEPIGNGKSVKQTSTAKKRNTSNETVDGWPKKQKKSKGVENLTPQKYRGQTTVTVTTEQVELAAADVDSIPNPDTPVAPQTTIEHEKVNDYRYEKRIITEVIDENATALIGRRAYEQRQMVNTSEILVGDGASADSGLLIVSSQVTPIGNGKSVKENITVDGWGEHTGSEWDVSLGIQVPFTEQFVAPPTAFDEANTSFKIVNSDRSLKVVRSVPSNLDSIHHIMPTQETVDLPGTLLSASVIVSRVLSNNNSLAIGQSYSVSNSSQVAVSADIDYEMEDGYSGPVDAEIHVFYMPLGTTTEAILARTTSSKFPRFKPKANRVIVSGWGLSKSVTMGGSSGGGSVSENSDIQSFVTAVAFPSSIHAEIPITISYNDHVAPTGMADAYVDQIIARQAAWIDRIRASIAAGNPVFNLDPEDTASAAAIEGYLESLEGQVDLATDLTLDDFTVNLSTATLPATDVTVVPSGRYLKNSRITDYDYGYVQVVATVVII